MKVPFFTGALGSTEIARVNWEGAIAIAVKGETKNICIDTDKCNGCGVCRQVCMTWSRDKTMTRKLPWLSSRLD